jgi:opacity protein-like surface antigen
MKGHTMLRSAGILCTVSLLALAAPAQAAAAETQQASSPHGAEWSSMHKEGKPHRKAANKSAAKRKQAVAVRAQPYPYRAWRGPDPSFDEYGRLYTNPYPGKCMVDLGYGRWADCSSDP